MDDAIDFEQLVTGAGDAVVVCDTTGMITFWNPAAERLFGFTAAEAIGQSLDIIVPERQRQRHWDGYHKTMETGTTRYGTSLLRVPALHKDGHGFSIAFTVSLLKAEDGATRQIVAILRDDTDRFTTERDLRRQLRELRTAPDGAEVAT